MHFKSVTNKAKIIIYTLIINNINILLIKIKNNLLNNTIHINQISEIESKKYN